MNMSPVLFRIYGPIAVHWYGVCIALGIIVAIFLLRKDTRLQKIMNMSDFFELLQKMIFAGYVSARLFSFVFDARSFLDFLDIFKFWQPGFSILGCVIGIVATLLWYVYCHNIQGLALLDRLAIYAPLVQGFGRIGCFFAGCCHGKIAQTAWSVVYTNPASAALLYAPVHPAQLYSAISLFCIFLIFYFFLQQRIATPGLLACFYLCAISVERFLLDFVRYDYTQVSFWNVISQQQMLALTIFTLSLFGIVFLKFKHKN